MTIETQIAELLAQAAPLRCLPDREAEAKGLPALVDRINALRALEAAGVVEVLTGMHPAMHYEAAVEGADALQTLTEIDEMIGEITPPARKKPGRKPKAAAE